MANPSPSNVMKRIAGMRGLGDNIYCRPFVRAACDHGPVWLSTPWPELFDDLPGIAFGQIDTQLRTQQKNIRRQPPDRWTPMPFGPPAGLQYADRLNLPVTVAIERHLPLQGAPFVFDLPAFPRYWYDFGGPYAVIRPVTERSEWQAPARSPHPAYIAAAAAELRAVGYHVVSVADLSDPQEWLVGPAPVVDTAFHSGELNVTELLSVVAHASVVVGGPGWIVPAAIAAGVPLITIGGGCGLPNGPERLTDPRMDLSRTAWILPDRFCRCDSRVHACDKSIDDFDAKFAEALEVVLAEAPC